MQPPLSFQPVKQEVNTVPLDMYNELVEKLALTEDELKRCRQKVAHLLKDKEPGRDSE